MSAFAWLTIDMPGIDPDFLCHWLMIDPQTSPVSQRRRKYNEEKKLAIQEETTTLV